MVRSCMLERLGVISNLLYSSSQVQPEPVLHYRTVRGKSVPQASPDAHLVLVLRLYQLIHIPASSNNLTLPKNGLLF